MDYSNLTVDDLYVNGGRLNSAILRREEFLNSKLVKSVLEKTKELDIFPKIKLSDRINFIHYSCKLNHCKKCGKPYLNLPWKNGVNLTLCNCKKNYTDESKRQLLLHREQKKLELKKELTAKISMGELTCSDFKLKFEDFFNKPDNFGFELTPEILDFIADLLIKTKNILPVNEDDLEIPQRLYLLKHNLTVIPICKYCGKSTTFYNRKTGYAKTCGSMECKIKLGNATREQKYINLIPSLINDEKYEIISIPSLLNKERLVIKCKKCGLVNEIDARNGFLTTLSKESPLCRCEHEGYSKPELDVFNFIKEISEDDKIIQHDRTLLPSKKEIDIYIPSKNLAVEFDGLYWHSEAQGKYKNYHLEKTEECEKLGIQLIHIFENEWLLKQEIVKSRLKQLLGVTPNITGARKCIVKEINSSTANEFLNQNHIQGKANAKISLGLFYNEELVEVMTFNKPRFNKKIEWELIRLCSKQDWSITGGANKLLHYFETKYNPESIISYADRRWSKGNVYIKLGFKEINKSEPNYWYFKENLNLLNRVKFQKHLLPGILGEGFNPDLSEYENMKQNGYSRIFDSGNLVFIKSY